MSCTVKKEFLPDPDIMLLPNASTFFIYDMGITTASSSGGLDRMSSPALNVYAQALPLN